MDEVMDGISSQSPICSDTQQTALSEYHAIDQQSIDIDLIVRLVNTLYNSHNPDEQNEANRRLTEIPSSPNAWHICWVLLDPNQDYPNEVHFFAANLLVLKINQSWASNDVHWLEEQLRPKLFETLVNYAASPHGTKTVIDRLALALANFALHSIPTFWTDAIEEIVQTLTSQDLSAHIPPQRICDILLRILTFIPEEYSVIVPSHQDRATLSGQISKSGPIVFKFLHKLLMNDKTITDSECQKEVLKCLTSWVMHSQTSLLELEDGKDLLNLIYGLINDDEMCSAACATLAATFDQRAENFRNSIIAFMPKLANLKNIIDSYITQDEVECVIKIYSLVINFCENHSKLMIKIALDDNIPIDGAIKETTKQSVFILIKMILDCTAAPGIFGIDEKYSEITFPFWFSFLADFYYFTDKYTEMVCDLFDPLVDSLLQSLIKKAQFPPTETYYNSWNDDQREEYRRYRHDLGDVLSLIVQFPLARERIIEQLYDQLRHELHQLIQATQKSRPQSHIDELPWQSLESVIYGLKSIAETVPFDELNVVPRIFELLDRIPFADCQAPELYCTTTEMISSYADWLFVHTDQLALSFRILFLGVAAPNPQVRLMSTMSLKDITNECQQVLPPFAESIVKSCTEALLMHDNSLDTMEKARLMHTFGCAVVMAPTATISSAVNTITNPILTELRVKAMEQPSSDDTVRRIIFDRLHMLNSLIESLHVKQYSGNAYEDVDENNFHLCDPPIYDPDRNSYMDTSVGQPVVSVLRQLIPVLNIITGKYRNDEQMMSKVSGTVKKSAKNLSIELKPVLKDLMGIIVNAYDPSLNFTILQDIVPLFNIFKVDPTVFDLLKSAFVSITERTLNCCYSSPLAQLSVTVEVYFRFAHLVCKKFAEEYLIEPSINVGLIYKLALTSLELPEKRTLVEVCNFISLFRVKSLGVPHLHAIFVDNLDALLTTIFNIFGGNHSTPKYALDCVMDMFFFVLDADESRTHLDSIALRDNFPTPYVTRDQKIHFISALTLESKRRNRRKIKDACNDFVLLSRNLNRSR